MSLITYTILQSYISPDGWDVDIQMADGTTQSLHDCDGQPDDIDGWIQGILQAQSVINNEPPNDQPPMMEI